MNPAPPAHTPGPWSVHPEHAWVCPSAAMDEPVCALQWPSVIRTEEETKANARLIAASPDLLAALEAYVAALEDGPENLSLNRAEELEETARTALAKATA